MAQNVLAKVAVEIAANTAAFNAGLAKAEGSLNRFSGKLNNFATTIAAGFGITEIAKGVINVTSEFQKFEAVLTNTLGSNSTAKNALDGIREFAIRTPFEVSELTAAYVRWTNQGLTPTISKLQMLGDVASSLGAGFEQTAEAFKDLAVGQTKRIEEIGILATQQNGKIQLSFKGVNIEIEKNAEGVQKALETYSKLNGVLGSTDAVSKTLGGRISNLKDAWDNFLLTLGQSNSGLLYGTVEALTNIANAAANAGSELELWGRQIAALALKGNPFINLFTDAPQKLTEFKNLSKETQDYVFRYLKTNSEKSIQSIIGEIEANRTANELLQDKLDLQKQFIDAFTKEGEDINDVNGFWDYYIKNLNKRLQLERDAERAAATQKALNDKRIADEQKAAAAADARAKKDKETANAAIQRIKDEQYAWEEMMRERTRTLKDLEKEIGPIIKITEDLAVAVRYAASELFNFKPLTELKGAQDLLGIPTDISQQIANYKGLITTATNANAEFSKSVQQLNMSFADAARGGLQDFFVGLGDVAAKQVTFGELILKSLANFMKQFGAALIALGIGKIKLDELFTAPGGGFAAIAAGTALVVAASLTSKWAARQSQNVGNSRGSSGASFAGQTISAYGMTNTIEITGQLKGSGRDLVAVINQTNFDNSIRKGG